VVDTIGAGDSFMGAVIHQLVVGELATRLRSGESLGPRELELVGRSAANVAAVTVSRPGADPPWRIELPTFVGGWRV
jgi:fructokinase